jgi:hypothetical protein
MDQGCEALRTPFAIEQSELPIELEPPCPRMPALSPQLQTVIIKRAARSDLICNLTLATAFVMAMALLGWRRSPAPPPAPVSSPALAVIPPVTLPEPKTSPVRVRNPFDLTEVFEFPPGTRQAEARETVAELLLERARHRRG